MPRLLTAPVYIEEGGWIALVADNTTATVYRGPVGAFTSDLSKGVSHHGNSAMPLPATATPAATPGTLFSFILVGVA